MRVRRDTGPADIARVGGYLRLQKYDVHTFLPLLLLQTLYKAF